MPISNVQIRGKVEAQREMERIAGELHGMPMLTAMRTSALLVERDAKQNAPVDTGRLRASITSQVMTTGAMGRNVRGVVGSNVIYSAAVELGSKPHFPPVRALETWARRKGLNAWAVAKGIAKRGTKAQRYLQRAFESNRARVVALIEQAVRGIVR